MRVGYYWESLYFKLTHRESREDPTVECEHCHFIAASPTVTLVADKADLDKQDLAKDSENCNSEGALVKDVSKEK